MLPDRFRRLRAVLERRQPDLTVLMDRVHKPHNFSAVLRNCDAVGVLEAHMVPGKGGLTPDAEASAGTAKWIRLHRHPEGPGAVRSLRAAGHQVIAAHPGPGAVDFREPDYTVPTAFVLGAELRGIARETLAAADRTVRIPMTGMVRSLNVSVSAAVLLYEAYRQRERAGLYRESRLDRERRRALLFEWAYPELARRFRARGFPYPELGEDGEILGSLDPVRGRPTG